MAATWEFNTHDKSEKKEKKLCQVLLFAKRPGGIRSAKILNWREKTKFEENRGGKIVILAGIFGAKRCKIFAERVF